MRRSVSIQIYIASICILVIAVIFLSTAPLGYSQDASALNSPTDAEMRHWQFSFTNGFAAIFGSCCLVGALCLYDEEHSKFQKFIENGWVFLEDMKSNAINRHLAFLRTVAMLTDRWLTACFGTRLMSVHAISVSVGSSICSGMLAEFFGAVQAEKLYVAKSIELLVILVLGVFFLTMTALTITKKIPAWVSLVVYIVAAELLLLSIDFIAPPPESVMPGVSGIFNGSVIFTVILLALVATMGLIGIALFFLVSTILDFVFISIMRKVVNVSQSASSAWYVILIFITNCLFAVTYFFVPYFSSYFLVIQSPTAEYNIFIEICFILSQLYGFKYTILFPTASFVVLSGAMLLHRMVIPMLSRPLYGLHKLGVAKHKKLLIAVGIISVTTAFPGVKEWLKSLFAAI